MNNKEKLIEIINSIEDDKLIYFLLQYISKLISHGKR